MTPFLFCSISSDAFVISTLVDLYSCVYGCRRGVGWAPALYLWENDVRTDFWQNHKWLTSFLVAIAMLLVIALAICFGMFLIWLLNVNRIGFIVLVLTIIFIIMFRIAIE